MDTPNWTSNDWADYWRYEVGVNVIPANPANRSRPTWILWKENGYQNNPILEEQHEQWKKDDAFAKGMAVIAGKVWHTKDTSKNNLYLILVDLDNQKAIDEFCTRNGVTTPLSEMAKTLIVEQHDDMPYKAHVMFYASYPFKKKSSDKTLKAMADKIDRNEIPALEIKGDGQHGILFVTPSTHWNGHNYRIIGTNELNSTTLYDAFETHLDNICNKYGIPYLTDGNGSLADSKIPITDLFAEDTRIYEGHNRHEALLRAMESLFKRNKGILTEEQIIKLAHEWNQKHCIPPLEPKAFSKQWKSAKTFVERKEIADNNLEKYPELTNNIYYQINERPQKYIIAYKQNHHVIEATVKSFTRTIGNNEITKEYLQHNKNLLNMHSY